MSVSKNGRFEVWVQKAILGRKAEDAALVCECASGRTVEQSWAFLQPIAQAFRDHIFEQGSQLVSRVDFSQEEHKEHTKIKEILS